MPTPSDGAAATATPPGAEPAGARRFRSLGRTAAEVAVFVGLYLSIGAFQERHLLGRSSTAPSFSLPALQGGTVSLESLRGKRVLVHFWATWCGVCRQEFGALDAVQRGLTADEALVTVVADSDDAGRLRDFVAKEHIHYPVLLGDPSTLRAFKVDAFPTNYFLDGSGRITSHTVGMSTRWSLAARLALAR